MKTIQTQIEFHMMSKTLVVIVCICIFGTSLRPVESLAVGSRALSKRSFYDIRCKGMYNKGIFARLDRICDDCYNLYQEPQIHSLCRSNCFGSTYFKGCLDALQLSDEESKYDEMIEMLGKK